MPKVVCFTGHRAVARADSVKRRLRRLLEKLIADGADTFLCGGAVGFDLLCEETVLKLRKKHPQIQLHIIMPCPETEQTKKWNEADKLKYRKILTEADKQEQCSDRYYDGCMRERNKRLVDLADLYVCYYNENDRRSGTGQTVNLAKQKGIEIKNLFID